MTPLRAAVIGLGNMGRNHARVLETLVGVDLVAAIDPVGDPHDAAPGARIHDTLATLAGDAVDFCVLATPTESHTSHAIALAERGIPTLIEKPLAPTTGGCDQVIRAFAAAGVVASVGHVERFNPAILALRDQLDEGSVGSVLQIATRRQGPHPTRIRDVGVTKDLGTHDFDLAAWIGGAAYDRVHAEVVAHGVSDHDDVLVASGRLTNGVVVNHVVNWITPVKERSTIVSCEAGTLIADTLNVDLIVQSPATQSSDWELVRHGRGVREGDVTRVAIPKREPLVAELTAFCDRLRGDEAPTGLATLEEGRAAVETAERCLGSDGRS